jgi:hypothetical protein
MVTAAHRAHRCLERTAAGVLKGLARPEQRLLTDHAQATNLVLTPFTVRNNPVATDHLGWALTRIGNPDLIGKNKLLFARIRLLRHKMRLNHD